MGHELLNVTQCQLLLEMRTGTCLFTKKHCCDYNWTSTQQ